MDYGARHSACAGAGDSEIEMDLRSGSEDLK